MHGAIMIELRDFATEIFGADAWHEILRTAGFRAPIYLPIATYPDEQVVALVEAAARLTGKSGREILMGFGEYLAPRLFEMYRNLIEPSWRTLDLIAHTESTIHRIVRLRDPDATPPRLSCQRLSPTEVLLTYDSARRLCSLARGLARGFARQYAESIEDTERECMLRGSSRCVISFRLTAPASAR